ncbi:uncharacterized protein LOC143549543 [Bidens hawaiensis]|uniref:uncharacterized protein LOC143549543 n=1 Tax=Bidens hawaiensis TaxID=980011 RepID=UPI0040496CE4
MADDLVIKIGDMGFQSFDDWLNLDVVNKLPIDPFEMNNNNNINNNITGGCTMIRGWIQELDDDKFDDKNGFFLFDELSKKALHPIKKLDDDIGYINISERSIGGEKFDDKNGFFLFDELSKKALHPIKKLDDDIGYINISERSFGDEKFDDKNGFFLFDEMSKKALHLIKKLDDDIGYINISERSFGDEKFDDKNGFFLFDEMSKKILRPIKKLDDEDDVDDDDIGYVNISERSIGNKYFGDKNGFFLLDELSGNVLQPIKKHDDEDGGDVCAPHDALFLALGHLGIRDLLSVERVCKSFRDGVRDDPLLWRNISIDQPVGESFDDDSLLRITNRANGSLQSLSLFKCLKITDTGLKDVFQKNLGLMKLSVVGCNGLSMEGLLTNMKSFGGSQIKRLRIGGLHSITTEQFQELSELLSLNNRNKVGPPKPRFFNGGQLYLSLDDNRLLDIESCPKCQQIRQVYDCPAAGCGGKHNNCRACTFCIPRCTSCGCCFNERDYIETFCLDLLCLDCLARFLRFPDCEDEDISIRGFHQQASYHFYLYG